MIGEIGRLLVCGNRTMPMKENEITLVHKYLMTKWKINEKAEAFDICKWMPRFILSHYRESEERFCFLINDPTKDLIPGHGAYKVWKSRSKHRQRNALGIEASSKCMKVKENKWALTFSKSLYKINDMGITTDNCFTLCITFQLNVDETNASNTQQTIFTDYDGTSSTFRSLTVLKDGR